MMLVIAHRHRYCQLQPIDIDTASYSLSSQILLVIAHRHRYCQLQPIDIDTADCSSQTQILLTSLYPQRSCTLCLLSLQFETSAASSVLEKLQQEKDAVGRTVNQKVSELEQQRKKLETNKVNQPHISYNQQLNIGPMLMTWCNVTIADCYVSYLSSSDNLQQIVLCLNVFHFSIFIFFLMLISVDSLTLSNYMCCLYDLLSSVYFLCPYQ